MIERHGVRRPAAVCLALVVLLSLGGLTGCGALLDSGEKSSLSVPDLFYLRPHGDDSGPQEKTPFHVRAEDVTARSRAGTQDHRLTVDVTGSGRAVRLKISKIRKPQVRRDRHQGRLQGQRRLRQLVRPGPGVPVRRPGRQARRQRDGPVPLQYAEGEDARREHPRRRRRTRRHGPYDEGL
ncbi:hypothetical protein ACTMUQ_36875 [Streptomyces sp. SD11]|uniref:hypothetical protein n=1 Tax=Streptomyces sp. SD11 TaxID=3452209 RepID=UPI003F89B4E3